MSPFKREKRGPSNFDASTSSRLIAFLRTRSFLSAHLTSTKKLGWTDESISWDSDFLSLAIGTALAERHMMNCGRRNGWWMRRIVILFFFTIASSLSLLFACFIERQTRTTEIFNYLRKSAARWVIEKKDRVGTDRRSVRWIIARFARFAKWNLRFVKLSFYEENAFPLNERTPPFRTDLISCFILSLQFWTLRQS